VTRLRAVRDATAAPVRRADRSLPCPAGALLPPRLRATARHLGARARAVRAGARGRELRGDDLVHDGDVRLDAEQRVGDVDRAGIVAGRLLHRDGRHHCAPAFARFTASRTNTRPPVGPGTEPRTSRRPRSASPSTTCRLSVVTRSWPYCPAIRVPLNTRAGVAHAPIEPGARCFLWLPCDAPLPLEMPVTSTRSPAPKRSARTT